MSSARSIHSTCLTSVFAALLPAATLVFLSACNDQSAPKPAAEALATAAQRVVRESGVPGIAIAVITSNAIDTAASGVLKLGQTAMLNTQNRMHLGSNIKAMTATLTAALVESGAISWTTTIVDAFPELRATMRAEYLDVTVDDLLAHRGGILPFTDPAEFAQLPILPDDELSARTAATAWLAGLSRGQAKKGLQS